MTLVYDRRPHLRGKPGCHAFLVGVSSYPHLRGGTGRPAPERLKMGQLSSSALTVYQVFRWLVDRQDRLAAPLATCRVLHSPSEAELAAEPELEKLSDLSQPADLDSFLEAASEWREDAASDQANITFFYFAGYAVQRSRGEAALLLSNLGDGRGGILRNSVDVYSMFLGMAPSEMYPSLASTQLYFIDSVRVGSHEFVTTDWLAATPVFDIVLSGAENRSSVPMFYSWAAPDRPQLHSVAPTAFGKALLTCLSGEAAVPLESESGLETEGWVVTVHSLTEGLRRHSEEQRAMDPSSSWDLEVGGLSGRDAPIHHLDSRPTAEVLFDLEPEHLAAHARIRVTDEEGNVVLDVGPPAIPLPRPIRLPAGPYLMDVTIEPPLPEYPSHLTRATMVLPPRSRWRVRLGR